MRTQMSNTGSLKITPFTGNIGKFFRSAKPATLAGDHKIVTSPETRWVETLSNPKKPNIWAGKGPSFDSDGDNWARRILDNGYMTHYKNDAERAMEMLRDSRVDMTQTFEGSQEREPVRMTFGQRKSREERNFTKNSTGVGKRNHPTEIYQCKIYEYITVLRCEETVGKGRAHDSHGQHGRKPRYKDSLNHRPQD